VRISEEHLVLPNHELRKELADHLDLFEEKDWHLRTNASASAQMLRVQAKPIEEGLDMEHTALETISCDSSTLTGLVQYGVRASVQQPLPTCRSFLLNGMPNISERVVWCHRKIFPMSEGILSSVSPCPTMS
jgi:hypothetical protein